MWVYQVTSWCGYTDWWSQRTTCLTILCSGVRSECQLVTLLKINRKASNRVSGGKLMEKKKLTGQSLLTHGLIDPLICGCRLWGLWKDGYRKWGFEWGGKRGKCCMKEVSPVYWAWHQSDLGKPATDHDLEARKTACQSARGWPNVEGDQVTAPPGANFTKYGSGQVSGTGAAPYMALKSSIYGTKFSIWH